MSLCVCVCVCVSLPRDDIHTHTHTHAHTRTHTHTKTPFPHTNAHLHTLCYHTHTHSLPHTHTHIHTHHHHHPVYMISYQYFRSPSPGGRSDIATLTADVIGRAFIHTRFFLCRGISNETPLCYPDFTHTRTHMHTNTPFSPLYPTLLPVL